jgi:hypothetical protein
MCGQLHAPAALPLGKNPGTRLIGGSFIRRGFLNWLIYRGGIWTPSVVGLKDITMCRVCIYAQ